MLKKYHEIKRTMEEHFTFDQIKKAIGQSLVLINPDYSKEFMIFLFASENTIFVVML